MSRLLKLGFCVKCARESPVRKATTGPERGRHVCVTCGERVMMPNKYRSIPTKSKHTGRTFMSKLEANREPALIALQNVGAITDLQYQVPFRLELYSTQAVDALLEYVEALGAAGWSSMASGLSLTQDVRRSRQCVGKWLADFAYRQDGQLVAEDSKGYATPVYKLKKKLMVLAHNLEIQEPKQGGVQQRARGAGISGRGTGSRLSGNRA